MFKRLSLALKVAKSSCKLLEIFVRKSVSFVNQLLQKFSVAASKTSG
jgi:hypothetical protein